MYIRHYIKKIVNHERLYPFRVRAFRDALSFMPPVIMYGLGWISPLQAMIASFTAHSMCMIDIHGGYRHKSLILSLLALVMISMAWAGTMVGEHVFPALIFAVLFAMLSGVFRHYIREYAGPLATPAALMLFTAMSAPVSARTDWGLAIVLTALGGSCWGFVLCNCKWLIDRAYPLRYAVAELWLALAAYADAVADDAEADRSKGNKGKSGEKRKEKAALVKQAMQRARGALQRRDLKTELGQIALLLRFLDEGKRLHFLLSEDGEESETHSLIDGRTIAQASRAVALAIISPKPLNYRQAKKNIGLIEFFNSSVLVRDLRSLVGKEDVEEEIAAQKETGFFDAGSSDGFLGNIVENKLVLQYSICLAVILAIGTAVFIGFKLPHGYWIPFSSLVVLQPEMMLTRRKALHRCVGTFAGIMVIQIVFYIHFPHPVVLVFIALLSSAIAFQMKRHYGSGVFVVTMLMVLQMQEITRHVGYGFLAERLLCCSLGSILAFIALWVMTHRSRTSAQLSHAMS